MVLPKHVMIAVNDRVDVRSWLEPMEFQLGKRSLGVKEVRRIASGGVLVGASVITSRDRLPPRRLVPDPVTLGHVFATSSHPGTSPREDLTWLAEVVRTISIPVIAIGGINIGNIEAVHRAGVDGVAVISADS